MCQKPFQRLWQWGLQCDPLIIQRMRETHFPGMKEHALQPFLGERLVQRKVPVFLVAGDWKAEMGQMDTNLMCPPGLELGFKQAEAFPALDQTKDRM